MVEEDESYSDIELDMPPKITFEDLRQQVLKDPKIATKRLDLLRTLYYYSKDTKKHYRIIKSLFWALIVPLLQDHENKKTALFGLKSMNQLIENESSHEQIIGLGKVQKFEENKNVTKAIKKVIQTDAEKFDKNENNKNILDESPEKQSKKFIEQMGSLIVSKQNPVRILVSIILKTDSNQIMFEATKAIQNLARTEEVIEMLMVEKELLRIMKEKFATVNTKSQENILLTVSQACKLQKYRNNFADDAEFLTILFSQVKSISKQVTYCSLKILRQLAQDADNLDKLQGKNLRLSKELIYGFQWLDALITKEDKMIQQQQKNSQIANISYQPSSAHRNKIQPEEVQLFQLVHTSKQNNDMIFREISKAFEYIFKYYELHKEKLKNLIEEARQEQKLQQKDGEDQEDTQYIDQTENEIIRTIVQLGRLTRDPKTTLNAATSLAHVTDVLDCNEDVATDDAIEFMIDMLKDTKNIKLHRQGCRYFANLSFYEQHREKLIEKDIASYLLKAIDGNLDEDTIKHSAIALANLSSHRDFMRIQNSKGDIGQSQKTEKWMIKPLIHLLDSAEDQKRDLIQITSITLCNMASKPSLHKHFIYEPEISTLKNCLTLPIQDGKCNEMTKFMIKLVCNLAKNEKVIQHLIKKGFLGILFDLLNLDREKEIFGNVVTAIAYLSINTYAQEQIIQNNIIHKILDPLTQIPQVDQKMLIIAITTMLFNGFENNYRLQKEFIDKGVLGKLLFFLQQKDSQIFYQLSCKCFSMLSENEENLQKIIDQECLNTIIISCLRSKEIDLETLKEVTKIFINLILWRKIGKENNQTVNQAVAAQSKPENNKDIIETICCLCDIGLMIDDLEMNILAMFCLNALSENESHHSYITKQKYKLPGIDENKQKNSKSTSNTVKIFPRINYLLERNQKQLSFDETFLSKRNFLIDLITSFYLNLARNESNHEFLLEQQLFKLLNDVMIEINSTKDLGQPTQTALCYTNSIFSKLLKHENSREQCIKDGGYNLFISILQSEDNRHLFLETLDSIKLFLAKRKFLQHFNKIPQFIYLDKSDQELNVSYLQVLSILSFEKGNHKSLKDIQFEQKLETCDIFSQVFSNFEHLLKEKKELKEQQKREKQKLLQKQQMEQELIDQEEQLDIEFLEDNGDEVRDLQRIVSNNQTLLSTRPQRVNRFKAINDARMQELTLSVSIIFSNLSYDQQYIDQLFGVQKWKDKLAKLNQREFDSLTKKDFYVNSEAREAQLKQILEQPEVKRMTCILNLLSHPHPIVSEQISILLANVSNNPHFQYEFISDRCMKSIIKILRFETKEGHKELRSEVSILGIMITILNLSANRDIMKGIHNMCFLNSLQALIKDKEKKSLENLAIGLMAISNIYSHSVGQVDIDPETTEFAFEVLQTWKEKEKEVKTGKKPEEQSEIVKNLVYAALLFFYNTLLDKRNQKKSLSTVEKLIDQMQIHVMDDFLDEDMIVSVVLQLITLFSDTKFSYKLFENEKILNYVFCRLKNPEPKPNNSEQIVHLAVIALSRFSSNCESITNSINSELYREQFTKFDSFQYMINYIEEKVIKPLNLTNEATQEIQISNGTLTGGQNLAVDSEGRKYLSGPNQQNQISPLLYQTLSSLLNIIENTTSVEELREQMDSKELFNAVINRLYRPNLPLECKMSLINIIFNLNFNLVTPALLPPSFLNLLNKTYKELGSTEQAIKKKIMSIVVVGSAFEANHDAIIMSGFYTQMKRNVNEDFKSMQSRNEEIELFGLVNIALNKRKMDLISADLKKIHKLAINNKKIDFQTKVDMFKEISKYVASVVKFEHKEKQESSDKGAAQVEDKQQTEPQGQIVGECLNALVFTLIRLTGQLDDKNYTMFKYFLLAILDTAKNLRHHLKYLIKLKKLIDYLKQVLQKNYSFEKTQDVTGQTEDKVSEETQLNFCLRMIVCDIFFELKFEKDFFKIKNISEAIKLLIQFSQGAMKMKTEKKTLYVSNTLRLISEMINSVYQMQNANKIIQDTNAIEFVTKNLPLHQDCQPCISIDALFCLSNLMNIQGMPEHELLCKKEIIMHAYIIYQAFHEKTPGLTDLIITYFYSISKFHKYHAFLKTMFTPLFNLLQTQINSKKLTYTEIEKKFSSKQGVSLHVQDNWLASDISCRQKLFSIFHNLSETPEICFNIDVQKYIELVNSMFENCVEIKMQKEEKEKEMEEVKNLRTAIRIDFRELLKYYPGENVFELAIKTMMNINQNAKSMEEVNLQDLFENISKMYGYFDTLAKQFALRLVTCLTSGWRHDALEKYIDQIIDILNNFISNCDLVVEIKLVVLNLNKITHHKKLTAMLASKPEIKGIITNIGQFLEKHLKSENDMDSEFFHPIMEVINFCKKLSAFNQTQEFLITANLHNISFDYLDKVKQQYQFACEASPPNQKEIETQLKNINMIMKLLKNLYSGAKNENEQNQISRDVDQYQDLVEEIYERWQVEKTKQNNEITELTVKIIVSFNSIKHHLDEEKVKAWIVEFTNKLIHSTTKPENKQASISTQYLDRFAHIIEMLVTNNLEKIDQNITQVIIKIYQESNYTHFSKLTWFKLLKTLAHLLNVQDNPDLGLKLTLLSFIQRAYNSTKENISFLYFIQVVILVTKKMDKIYENFKSEDVNTFETVLTMITEFFNNNYKQTNDDLINEILLYIVDYFRFLLYIDEKILHAFFVDNKIIEKLIQMLEFQQEEMILKSICQALADSSKMHWAQIIIINDAQLSNILQRIIKEDSQPFSQDPLGPLSTCLTEVLSCSKVPISYLFSTSILQLAEKQRNWENVQNCNIMNLLKILYHNLNELDKMQFNLDDSFQADGSEDKLKSIHAENKREQYTGLQFKSKKYSLLAITNILSHTQPVNMLLKNKSFDQNCLFLQLLLSEKTSFEFDPQMNLRFLSLILKALDDVSSHINEIDKDFIKPLVETTLKNICNFRSFFEKYDGFLSKFHKKGNYIFDSPLSQSSEHESPNIELTSLNDRSSFDLLASSNRNFGSKSPHQEKAKSQFEQTKLQNKFSEASQSNLKLQQMKSDYQRNTLIISDKSKLREVFGSIKKKRNPSIVERPEEDEEEFKESGEMQRKHIFYYENINKSKFLKIDAIQLNLCASLEILHKLSQQKLQAQQGQPTVQTILSDVNSRELFNYFIPFCKYSQFESLEYVAMVIDLVKTAQSKGLYKLLYDIDFVSQYVSMMSIFADMDQNDEYIVDCHNKILLPILKQLNFFALSSGGEENEDNYFREIAYSIQKQDSIQQILNNLKVIQHSKILEQVKTIQNFVEEFQKETINNDSGFIQESIQFFNYEKNPKDLFDRLKMIEHCVFSKQNNLEFTEIDHMAATILRRILHSLQTDQISSQDQTKLICAELRFCLQFLQKYQNKQIADKPRLSVNDTFEIVIQFYNRPPEKLIENTSQLGQSISASHQVHSVLEIKATYELLKNLMDLINNQENVETYRDFKKPILGILAAYSKTQNRLVEIAPLIFDLYQRVLDHTLDQNFQNEMFTDILDSMSAFLSRESDKKYLFQYSDGIPVLLQKLIIHPDFKERQLLSKFTQLIRVTFFQLFSLFKQTDSNSEQGHRSIEQIKEFVKFLITHESRQECREIGLIAIFFLSLGLKDIQNKAQFSDFLTDSSIISKLIKMVGSRGTEDQNCTRGIYLQRVIRLSDEMASKEEKMELMKFRVVALKVLVILAEYHNEIYQLSKVTEGHLIDRKNEASKIFKEIYFKHKLFDTLIILCQNLQDDSFTLEEAKLIARAFAALPQSEFIAELLDMPIYDQQSVQQSEESESCCMSSQQQPKIIQQQQFSMPNVNLMQYFKSLGQLIEKFNDSTVSYFAINALFCFILEVDLRAPNSIGKAKISKPSENFETADLKKLTLKEIDYCQLNFCLVKSGILQICLTQPTKIVDDDDLLKITMKLIIAVLFKSRNKKIFFQDNSEFQNQLQSVYSRLNMDLPKEKKNLSELFVIFVKKMHRFEIEQISQTSFMQFLNLACQVTHETSTPEDNCDERLKILPTRTILRDLVTSFNEIIFSFESTFKIHPNQNEKETVECLKRSSHFLFYFNYIFTISGNDIIESLSEIDNEDDFDYQGFFGNLNSMKHQSRKRSDQRYEESLKILKHLLASLIECLSIVKKQNMIIMPKKESSSQNKNSKQGVNQEKQEVGEDEEKKMQEMESNQDLIKKKESLSSIAIQITRLTLQNIDQILNKALENALLKENIQFTLENDSLQIFINLLTDFEDNGDIVEVVYNILEKSVRIANNKPEHQTVQTMESSKSLLRIAIKHSAVYQCCQSYYFLKLFINLSSKFKNKGEMQQALIKIVPQSIKSVEQKIGSQGSGITLTVQEEVQSQSLSQKSLNSNSQLPKNLSTK